MAKKAKKPAQQPDIMQAWLDENPEWIACMDLIAAPPTPDEIRERFPDADDEVVSRSLEHMRGPVSRGAHYWYMRSVEEQGDAFASMVALQKCAGLNTDDTFFRDSKPLYDQFGSQNHLDRYLKVAKKKGFKPSVHSTYFPGLARFQGDPEAFVTRAQGRGYIRKLCEKRGWACEGAVNVESRQPESDPLAPENCVDMAPDIVNSHARRMIAQDPKARTMNRRELREKILSKYGPSK